MPLLDLSLVTTSLTRLLERYIPESPVWDGSPPVNISITGDPPDMLAGLNQDYALSIYLFRVEEDGYRKNLPAPYGNNPPVRYSEMSLNLYYVLTANGGTQGNNLAHEREQRLMGIALKALHDYPILDGNTRIGTGSDPFVLPSGLRSGDDKLRLVLSPTSLDELNKLWTSMTAPLRLSTLYQVSVILIEAEQPSVAPIPVLKPQIQVFPFQSVWIQSTETDLSFILPGETSSRTITTSPALADVGESIRIRGSGFGGTSARVFLRHSLWSAPPFVEVTGWVKGPPTDPQPTDTVLELEVEAQAAGRDILPGLYQVYVRNGAALSNFSPLAIAPSIAPQSATPPGISPQNGPVGTNITITGGPYSGTNLNAEVYIGPVHLTMVTTAPYPGQFRVISANEIQASIPQALEPDHYPVRVVVNGIGTPPIRWFEVTP